MIYLIFGPDTYRSQKKIEELTSKYSSAQGYEKVDGEKASWPDLQRVLITPGFFEEKKLIKIDNLFTHGKAEVYNKVIKSLKNLSPDTIAVFHEKGELKKAIINKLPKDIIKEEFLQLSGSSLYNWIRQEISKQDGRIDPMAVQKIAFWCGPDLWRASNEIAKLTAYKKGHPIAPADVELLVRSPVSSNIFDLIDALGNKNLAQALKELKKLQAHGENELYIFTMIVYQFRNLIQIKELIDRGSSPGQIREKTGIHPYVIRKTLNQARNFPLAQLIRIYQRLLEAETGIKTGRSDPRLVLDLLVLGLAS